MKKVLVLSVMVLFAAAAFAQSSTTSNGHGKAVSSNAKETTLTGKEKGQSVSGIAKTNSDDEFDNDIKLSKEEKQARKAARKAENDARKEARMAEGRDVLADDPDNDGALTPEEKEARKAARRAEKDARRADRDDDGVLNGSAGDHNAHGKAVSGMARETTLEGREKGAAVSAAASARNKGTQRIKAGGAGKPAIAGRKAGAGRSGKLK